MGPVLKPSPSEGEVKPMTYPKPKVILEEATISDETRSKLQVLKQDYNDIVSQHISDIGLTHLEEMITKTDPELPPVASKLYPLPLKTQWICKGRNRKSIRSRTYWKISESICCIYYSSSEKKAKQVHIELEQRD